MAQDSAKPDPIPIFVGTLCMALLALFLKLSLPREDSVIKRAPASDRASEARIQDLEARVISLTQDLERLKRRELPKSSGS